MEELAILGGSPVRTRDIDLDPAMAPRELELINQVIESRKLSSNDGSMNPRFEAEFSRYIGAEYGITTNAGTSALHVALAAAGVGPGDEVILPAYTFIASATSILHNNAVPVFADILPDTLCIDPVDLEKRITEKTRVIMPVHLFGHPAEMDEILDIASDHDVKVVEDCAQAHAAEYRERKVGSFGDLGCFSFQRSKNITAGEGGIVLTNDKKMADACLRMRQQGRLFGTSARPVYDSFTLGYNFRMTEMQAAMLLAQLEKLDDFTETRIRNGKKMIEELSRFDWITCPTTKPYVKNVHHVFFIRVDSEKLGMDKDKLIEAYRAEGMYASPGYEFPLNRHPIFAEGIGFGGKKCPFDCLYYGGDARYQDLRPVTEEVVRDTIWVSSGWMVHNFTDVEIGDMVRAFEKIENSAKNR
ncbi:MAG: DegT/DnrJ/EryC1/StrS family aminotransferase [Theionarchaea archaeon]|nr:DegT/DnrJ/EryC1/StrS family aminotransferase [Theionarchaea archaeon]